MVRRNVSPQVGEDKVVALTFDDGPWPESTAAVLDVLADQGAKATFFTVGNRIDGEGVDLVKRAAAEGHQICSHSFDHAAGDGQSVNLGYMTPEDQVAEVQKGYEAIEAATGAEASHVFRTPGGNYGEGVMRNVGPLISAEIGWNIDSQDWRKPGAAAIANQVKNAWPGASCSCTTEAATDRKRSRRSKTRSPISSRRATASSPWTSCSAIRSPKPRFCRSPDEGLL